MTGGGTLVPKTNSKNDEKYIYSFLEWLIFLLARRYY
jgi:hypothetical protein